MDKQRCMGCMHSKSDNPICGHCGYDARTRNLPHQLKPGTVLQNQYIVGRALGQGGFGITYMGWDSFLNIPVAIKEFFLNGIVTRDSAVSDTVSLLREDTTELFVRNRERFIREATSLARLGRNSRINHIVRVQNLVQTNSTAYIIMEYVEGTDLRRYIQKKGRSLSFEETLKLLLPLIEDLETVHKNKIVHRDISPDNIMVQPDGTTKLIDFGAAHEMKQDTYDIRNSTDAILKYGFAPIEQYQRRGELGSWTDVYAMCATIYYCITGQFPPNATDRLLGDEDFAWENIPGISREQVKTLKRGTALRKEDRIQTMTELHRCLLEAETASDPGRTILMGISERQWDVQTAPLQEKEPYTAPVVYEELKTAPLAMSQEHTDSVQIPFTAPVENFPEKEPVPVPVTGTGKAESRKRKKKISPVFLAAAALAVVLGLFTLKPAKTVTPEVSADQGLWLENELARPEDLPGYSITGTFGSGIPANEITSVTFLDSLAREQSDSWDVSLRQDGSVKAWVVLNDGMYELYIGAEGGINAGADCSGLFKDYSGLQKVLFNGCFHTRDTQNMQDMFANCVSLTQLDLSGLDTGNVTDMSRMFYYCVRLEQLDVAGLDTGSVKNMNSMFSHCEKLSTLDLSGFDTGSATNMNYMFYGCYDLKKLDVSAFDTRNVITMMDMFNLTHRLKNVYMPKINTENVQNAWYFMDSEDTLNGRDWRNSFEKAAISAS